MKPLWVFVGSSVSAAKKSADEEDTVADVGKVLGFVARFLAEPAQAKAAVQTLLTKSGASTGLVSNNVDIFHGAFLYLLEKMRAGMTPNCKPTS